MQTRLVLAAMVFAAPLPAFAQSNGPHDNIDALIEQQAKANKVPAAFVHRVVKRESNYNPRARGGSALGLMQIKHATARGMGYTGDASGLYDPETNLKYGIAYLATAYRLAKGDIDQAYRYYNRGFYYAAKKLGIETAVPDEVPASGAVQTASSSNDFSKLFGLRSGQNAAPVQMASADPRAGIAGTTALAYAAPSGSVGPVEVPLPPRRPATLGGDTAPAHAETPVQVAAAPMAAGVPVQAAPAQNAIVASADLVEVPLPPRRPAATMLASMARPVTTARRTTAPAEVLEATALPAAQ
ncbi:MULTISPECIES: transglycosylase SLT domain-containing protein [Methylobacterium]|uniref:Membrane-bound lytic murein transglycosylase C n=1 Tax=Methylobacterium thuringiense TaxID=1003091 RepID=A0ABQ4TPL0_9HYPH|nr:MULTISPECIES: transglycosylase SLT domain-containing protein [Methylobacterium]TXN20892.1 transglycosylase SLT domain-containing protein [Methylobacterium sp. WL9]GJE56062.1 Membrane-bound lytic murein transglycosylase C [Methylobacterium thuringiense]